MEQSFVNKMRKEVMAIPVSKILQMRMNLIPKGNNYTGVCPFHGDQRPGNFIVNNNKGIFKCFACGPGGVGIEFIKLFDNKSYMDALIEIALHFNIVTPEELEKQRGMKYVKKKAPKPIKGKEVKKKEEKEPEIADEITRHKVYSLFLDQCDLTDEHKAHLMNERKITEDRIIKAKFRTFPEQWIIMNFFKEIKKEFKTLEVLKDIPGFFKEKKKNRKTGEEFWGWAFAELSGIIIPIRNEKGLIVGLQVRADNGELSGRYLWFSSNNTDNRKEGTPAKNEVDIVYPERIKNKAVIITEGRFKAEAIAKTYGSIAISVQGVTAWKDVPEKIKEIEKMIPNIQPFIAYDCDMHYNLNIWRQAKSLGESLEDLEKDVYYLIWNEENGKGIDDVIFSGNKENIAKIKNHDYDKKYILTLSRIESIQLKKIEDIEKEQIKKIRSLIG